MKKVKSNSAITLIALIITIIVLLILAGVVLAMVVGDNGILSKAQTAKEKTDGAQSQEEVDLAILENKLNNYSRTDTPATTENTMSGSEHFTGQYFFNGKKIYAKTIYISSLPNNNVVAYSHGISDVDIIWLDSTKSIIKYANNNYGSIPDVVPCSPSDGNKYEVGVNRIGSSTFSIRTACDRRDCSAYITLNYTKTTETGNGTTITATPAN